MPRIEGPRTFLSAPSSRQAGAGPPGGGALGTGVFLFLITHKQGAVAGSGCSLSFARFGLFHIKTIYRNTKLVFPKGIGIFYNDTDLYDPCSHTECQGRGAGEKGGAV